MYLMYYLINIIYDIDNVIQTILNIKKNCDSLKSVGIISFKYF